MAELFTKTDYKNFLKCGCYLWIAKKGKHLMPPPSASELFHQQEDEKIDVLAKQLFKGGVELSDFNEEGWRKSKKFFDEKQKVIFQPTVVTKSGLTCRADIVTYEQKGGAYDIREVSYKALTIQEGGTASVSWPRLTSSKIPAAEKEKLKSDMLIYCGLDTMAMVRILETLEMEVGNS